MNPTNKSACWPRRPMRHRLVNAEPPLYDEFVKRLSAGSESMTPPSLIVCERTGKWATALARHLTPTVRLQQTRGLGECVDALSASPASLLAVEVSRENLAKVLVLLGDLDRKFPLARAIVLADGGWERCQLLFREAGAVHFTASPRESQALVRLALRHLNRASPPRAETATRIWDALPWSEVA